MRPDWQPDWWHQPRTLSVVVDNDSWILPHAARLVEQCNQQGRDRATLCRSHADIAPGAVAFYLGCTRITPPEVLARNRKNLIVHESDLPAGRGFSPLSWQVLEGKNRIPVCLLEAVEAVDAGPVIYREALQFEGHELIDEMRDRLGRLTVELCARYLASPTLPEGEEQTGEASLYPRRTPKDSRLDPERSLAEQFNLLRIVDNANYPAFFEWQGQRYLLSIRKAEAPSA